MNKDLKKDVTILIIKIIFLLNFVISISFGGISISSNIIELKALENKKFCGICVYSTLTEKSIFTIEYSENFKKFIKKVEPNNFELEPIECPKDPEERRKCILEECLNPSSKSAKFICIEFEGPLEFSFYPQRMEYKGYFKSLEKAGNIVIALPIDFTVYYTPLSIWIVLLPIFYFLSFITIYFILKKFKTR